jgi:hypothetical protein
VISSNLDGFRVLLHSFDDLVAKIKEADEEKSRSGKNSERLLTAGRCFANQKLLDQ